MANWVINKLDLTGSDLNIVVNTLKNNEKLFESLIGLPPKNDDWVEANLNYWGTKWDVPAAEIKYLIDENKITLCFLTAWSPPLKFIENLTKKYDLIAYLFFYEPGCNIKANLIYKGGQIKINSH